MKTYTQIPPGTQILFGRAARRRRLLERAICSVFEGWSYEEVLGLIGALEKAVQ